MSKPRAKTVDMTRQRPDDKKLLAQISTYVLHETYARPQTRNDCKSVHRPCPFVGCKYNLYLDVSIDGLAIKLNYPDIEPGDMMPENSCALDVAARGEHTLEYVGALMNLTRERIRQIELDSLRQLQSIEEFFEFYEE